MSKLLWKSLIFSPAVLGATLLVSASGVRAADSTGLISVDNLVPTEATEVKTSEVQPMAKDAKASPLTVAAAQAAPAAPVTSEVEALAPIPGVPAANTTIAQAAPTGSNESEILDQINRYNREGLNNTNAQGQVTNVSQLRDVSPGDWAYEALRSLVERYGCIAGYPDGTYRGNRALSRYEFAAGLNACLNQIERLIAGQGGAVSREDFETLQRLVQEFQAELTTLGTRVDNLEGRVAFLEDHQFSTTTKLSGEAIFALTDEFNQNTDNNSVFQDRVRLTLNTSFTGTDRLVTRLAAGNADLFRDSGGAVLREGQQTFNIGDNDNDVVLDWLAYYFNFGSSKVYLAATGGIHSDYAPTLNPYFEDYDGGNGALSTFASESPIYRIGGGAGAAVSLGVGPLESILGPSTLTVGYLAGPNANNPGRDFGVFNGEYSALAQLNFNLGDRLGLGATYVHGYHNNESDIFDLGSGSGVVGSGFANNPRLASAAILDRPKVSNSYGIEAAFRLSENISISGYGAYTNVKFIGQGTGDIWTYGAGLAFSDFGREGNILGLFAGVEPTLRGLSGNVRPDGGFSRDNSWHFEGFYKYKLNDNISITPGIIWLTAPGQNEDNDDAIIGTLRTTFTF
ncbi:MAG TPA: iron uptake porin [Coleofasciculaceae cyanobacterium]